jgi:hypothetical protein
VNEGLLLLLCGHSAASKHFGVSSSAEAVTAQQIRDITRPELPLIWSQAEQFAAAQLAPGWTVYAQERWRGVPVLAGRRLGRGAILWTATRIGPGGYEKYPYLPQALRRLGIVPSLEARNLTVFFDASHRQRADIPYLVTRWRKAGIAAVHVTSWQFDQAPAEQARWLSRLIENCHRQGIAVYAWIELPHVSEAFWNEHPECREKTASGQDAQLDWRKLVNLVNPACSAAAEKDIISLLRSFDWDGANLGELYFESLEGMENPARFTPFSADAQRYFRAETNLELASLFQAGAKAEDVAKFLEARAKLAAGLQKHWLTVLRTFREERPNFDLILTHIDDRLDKNMRAALGADSARLLAATEDEDILFLVEDPATVWHLGPERYTELRRAYDGLTRNHGRLAIDLNIVERYQDVYPTKQQTGGELIELIHEAALNFERVALYFEASLLPEDLSLIASAAVNPERDSHWIRAESGLLLDGRAWPLCDPTHCLVPPGNHLVQPQAARKVSRIEPRNLQLISLDAENNLSYSARTAAWLFSNEPFSVEIDGHVLRATQHDVGEYSLKLPRARQKTVRLQLSATAATVAPNR